MLIHRTTASKFKKAFLLVITVTLIGAQGPGVRVLAQEATDVAPPESTEIQTTPTEPQADPPQTGTDVPTGAESPKYTYNEETGNWESEKYIWNPTTKQTAPKTPQEYSYNPETGQWDTTEWAYDSPSGQYVENTITVPEPSNTPTTPQTNQDTSTTSSPEAKQAVASQTGPNSQNSLTSTSARSGVFDLFYNTTISNNVNSLARSGNVLIGNNTTAGSAMSGDAISQATIVNLLQSAWNPYGGNFTTFSADINGDVRGDLVINPGQPTQNINVSDTDSTDLDVRSIADTNITNNINVVAESGDARITNNTSAGDATSGDTLAMANVLNLINTAISSGDSFMGTININGNLDGDILFPPGFLEQILARNASSQSSRDVDIDITDTTNTAVTNNITTDAGSGNAVVNNNTNAGSATSGNADNHVTILNMTGRQFVGENALLVFINVLGEWVGVIMDAPAGANSAIIGGGGTFNRSSEYDANYESETNTTLTNNINLTSQSGDAIVEGNTNAGSATSGNARTIANVANFNNSALSLSNWFGVLFINIFGTWMGSFGVDTIAGTSTPPPSSPSGQPIKVFTFVPQNPQDTPQPARFTPLRSQPITTASAQTQPEPQSATIVQSDNTTPPPAPAQDNQNSLSRTFPTMIVALATGAFFLALGSLITYIDRLLSRRKVSI